MSFLRTEPLALTTNVIKSGLVVRVKELLLVFKNVHTEIHLLFCGGSDTHDDTLGSDYGVLKQILFIFLSAYFVTELWLQQQGIWLDGLSKWRCKNRISVFIEVSFDRLLRCLHS